jgi:hypothetical protein
MVTAVAGAGETTDAESEALAALTRAAELKIQTDRAVAVYRHHKRNMVPARYQAMRELAAMRAMLADAEKHLKVETVVQTQANKVWIQITNVSKRPLENIQFDPCLRDKARSRLNLQQRHFCKRLEPGAKQRYCWVVPAPARAEIGWRGQIVQGAVRHSIRCPEGLARRVKEAEAKLAGKDQKEGGDF